MKRIILILALVVLLDPTGGVWAAQWCQWNGSAPIACQRDSNGVIMVDGYRKSGGAENFASFGYYPLITMPNPELIEGNKYTGWSYAFVNEEIQRTRQQAVNADAPTLTDYRIAKYQEMLERMNAIRQSECLDLGFLIPPSTRLKMVECVAAGIECTYDGTNASTGFYQGFTRSAAQAKAHLTACLAPEEAAMLRMYVDHPDTPEVPNDGLWEQIKACADKECVQAIQWDIPEDIPAGTY